MAENTNPLPPPPPPPPRRLLWLCLSIMMMVHTIEADITNTRYEKLPGYVTEDGVIVNNQVGTVAGCAVVCTSLANCDAFVVNSTTRPKTCKALRLPAAPVVTENTQHSGSSLYLPVGSNGKVQLTMKTNLDGKYGDWSTGTVCPNGGYVYGFVPTYVTYKGTGLTYDDCGFTGTKLLCRDDAGQSTDVSFVVDHPRNALRPQKECDPDDYVSGFLIYISTYSSSLDNEGMGTLRFICHKSGKVLVSYGTSRAGKWSEVRMCPEGMRICGMKLKHRINDRELIKDNTCVDEFAAICCSF